MPRFVKFLLLAIALAAVACSPPERLASVPRTDTARAMPLGIPDARFFADGDSSVMLAAGQRAFDREVAALRAEGKDPARTGLPPANYLAVSGGGDNGAFGAGLLNGWSRSGVLGSAAVAAAPAIAWVGRINRCWGSCRQLRVRR